MPMKPDVLGYSAFCCFNGPFPPRREYESSLLLGGLGLKDPTKDPCAVSSLF